MAAIEERRADLLDRAGVMLARGLPWEVVWRFPLEDQAAIESALLAERRAMRGPVSEGDGE